MVHRRTSEPDPQEHKKVALTFSYIDHGAKLVDDEPDNLVGLGMTVTSGAPGTWICPAD